MRLELVDILRCPRSHVESPLVVRIDAAADREIVTGTLVCPVCETRFAIADGAVVMQARSASAEGSVASGRAELASADEALRIAAFLGLTEPGGFIVLAGSVARDASAVAELADVEIVLLDPPPSRNATLGTPLYGPASALARGSTRGAVVPADGARHLEDLVATLRPGGRLLAAAALPVPTGVRELARDDEWWVAERVEIQPTVQLRGGRSRDNRP